MKQMTFSDTHAAVAILPRAGRIRLERRMLFVIAALAASVASAQAPQMLDESDCGPLASYGQYGPFDYRTSKAQLMVVEANHFNSDVEMLRRGQAGILGSDIDYTLRASPNHHRALMSMANLVLKTRNSKPPGANYTIECYFERASRLAPDDAAVPMIKGIFLDRIGKKQEALAALKDSERLAPENANVQYNIGLIYFDLKQYDQSLQYAQKAYARGFQLQGLKNKLQAAGKWPGAPATRAPSQGSADKKQTPVAKM